MRGWKNLEEQIKRTEESLYIVQKESTQLLPDAKQLAARLKKVMRERFGRNRRRLLLYILSASPCPLSDDGLSEIIGMEGKTFERLLKKSVQSFFVRWPAGKR